MKQNNIRGSRTLSLEQVLEFLRYSVPRYGTGYCPICQGPEFSINRKTQDWQCASQCGGGDVIDLLMKRMGINEDAAVLAYAEMSTAHGPLWWDEHTFIVSVERRLRSSRGTASDFQKDIHTFERQRTQQPLMGQRHNQPVQNQPTK
jgi:hypothetical protein